jgi:hypothetical protein
MHCFRYPSYVSYSPIRLSNEVRLKPFGAFRSDGFAACQSHGARFPARPNLTPKVAEQRDRHRQRSFGEHHG